MKTLLQRLETSDGYLRDVTLEFAEGLTCIIGARGTCKSTVVETIRFAHDLDPGRIKMLTDTGGGGSVTRGPRGLLRETIAGGTASCMIAMVDERGGTSKLRIERSIGTRGPRAYRDDVVDPEFSTHEVPIEIYSQGDLLAIAEDPEARLQLIDRPHIQQIAEIKTRLRDGQGQIEVLGGQIVKLRASIREDERGLAPQSELQQQLDVLARDRPTLDPRLEQERSEYEERERLAAKVRAYCQAFAQLFPSPRLESPPEQEVLAIEKELRASKIESAQSLADHLRQLADTAVVLERRLADAHELVAQTRPCVAALNAEFEERNERYRTLRREEEALSDALEREDRLRAQLRRIGRLRDDLELRMTRLESLLSSRREARREVEACLDEIFALRLQQIEQISTDLGHDISLDLVQSVQCGTYVEAIADLLQGTRLKRQRDIATRIVDLISPAELVDLIEAEEVDRLGELANLDSSQASRITNHFVDNMPRVQALEALVFEDQLNITMNVEGEVRPIEQLSRGQMATALLPLVLRHADFPLVFDQPEDDLDNRFVFDELVTRVRRLKQTRQLVFVTHNANIPVLGEADRVIVMSMANARQAAPLAVGTVDEMRKSILDILEGGAVAFAERSRRYEGMV